MDQGKSWGRDVSGRQGTQGGRERDKWKILHRFECTSNCQVDEDGNEATTKLLCSSFALNKALDSTYHR